MLRTPKELVIVVENKTMLGGLAIAAVSTIR